MRAADEAETTRAYREAAELRRRALPLIADPLKSALMRGRVGELLWFGGDTRAAAQELQLSVERLEGLGRDVEAEHFRLMRGRMHWQHFRHDLARDDFEHVIRILSPLGPSRDLALALTWSGGVEAVNDRGKAAEPRIRQAIEVATSIDAAEILLWAKQYLGVAFISQGRLEESNALLEESYRGAIAAGIPWLASNALNNLLSNFFYYSRPHEFPALVMKLTELGTEESTTLALQWEGCSAYLKGDLGAALDWFQRYRAAAQQFGGLRHLQLAELNIANCLTLLGRLDEAKPLVRMPRPEESKQHAVESAHVWCRHHLARGDAAGAAEGALAVHDDLEQLVRMLPSVDSVMEGLIAGGALEAAGEVAAAARANPAFIDQPPISLALGRYELAAGSASRAVELVSAAVEAFSANGDLVDELVARIALVRALKTPGISTKLDRRLRSALSPPETWGPGTSSSKPWRWRRIWVPYCRQRSKLRGRQDRARGSSRCCSPTCAATRH